MVKMIIDISQETNIALKLYMLNNNISNKPIAASKIIEDKLKK